MFDDNNADSFFDNFDQLIVIKSILQSPLTKDQTKSFAQKSSFNHENGKQICKSLETIFTQCNNLTIKKQNAIPREALKRFKTLENHQACRYNEPNKNHSLNQLKCLFQKKLEKYHKQSTLVFNKGAISQRLQINDQQPQIESFIQSQKQQQSQSYQMLKQQVQPKNSVNKSKSYLSFYKVNESNLSIKRTTEVTRKPIDSVDQRSKHPSLHSQGYLNTYKNNPYSMIQMLKLNNYENDKQRPNSLNRNNSPYVYPIYHYQNRPIVSSRVQKKPIQNISQDRIDFSGYYLNRQKKTESFFLQENFRKRENSRLIDNSRVDENSRLGENYSLHLNFADFKKYKIGVL